MGLAFKENGMISQALRTYKKALLIQPDFAEVNNNIGNLLKEQSLMQSNLWQVNCYIADALKHNNKLMTVDTQGRKKKNAH